MTAGVAPTDPRPSSLLRRVRSRHLLATAVLVGAWCALWGEVTIANLVSGLVVSVGLVGFSLRGRIGPDTGISGRVGIGALLRLIVFVAVELTMSTIAVAREVLTPGDQTNEAIIAMHLPDAARHHLLIMVVGITVTPGTAVVDSDADAGILYLHLLYGDQREEVEAGVQRLADLAFEAFPPVRAEGSRP